MHKTGSLIHPPREALADSLWLNDTPGHVLVNLLRHGVLTLDDAWEVVDPKQVGGNRKGWKVPTPRFLFWKFHSRASSPQRSEGPTEQGWANALDPDKAEDQTISDENRLLAWAFSHPKAWEKGPWSSQINTHWHNAVEWALNEGKSWAVDAALRQPKARDHVNAEWFERHLVDAVRKDNTDLARVLLDHGNIDVDNIWVSVSGYVNAPTVEVNRKNTINIDRVRALVSGQAHDLAIEIKRGSGTPLLHLASTPSMTRLLLDTGLDPMAQDEAGRTADEHWRARANKGVPYGAFLDQNTAKEMIGIFVDHVARNEIDVFSLTQRQGLDAFNSKEFSEFEQWVKAQGPDFTVGEELLLPSEVVEMGEDSARGLANRAALLLERMDEPALARKAEDGLEEREALWWMVWAGGLKKHAKVLEKHAGSNGWDHRLGALCTLMDRSEYFAKILWPPLSLFAIRALEVFNGKQPAPGEPGKEDLMECTEDGPTALDELMRALSKRIPANNLNLNDPQYQPTMRALFRLARHAIDHPTDSQGRPRQHLLDATLLLFARIPNGTAMRDAQGVFDGVAVQSSEYMPLPALIDGARYLADAGAAPSASVIEALESNQVVEFNLPQLIQWAKQQRMHAALAAGQAPKKRLRM